MNDEPPLYSSDSEMASKEKKNRHSTFEKQVKINFYYPKIQDDALLKNRSKRPAFIIRPLNSMLNIEVEILSLHQLDYKMDRTDYPFN